MFGYTASVCKSCSSLDAVSTYQGAFCGLSCGLASGYTPAARFLVNRDSTFLSLLGLSLQADEPVVARRACCNPLAAAKPLLQNNLAVEYAAAVTVCGLATKLQDDADDEKGLRKMASQLLGNGIQPMTDKAIAYLNSLRFPTARVQDALLSQSQVEQGSPDLYAAAAPTAFAYGTIFEHLATTLDTTGLRDLGTSLGRLIYWRDAFDDIEQDRKQGRYNLLSYTPLPELQAAARQEQNSMQELLAALPLRRNNELLSQIAIATASKHEDLTESLYTRNKSKQNKRERFCNNFRDNCCNPCECCGDCCSSISVKKNGCCDQACDCGPGDTGCCDCGDCCSCN